MLYLIRQFVAIKIIISMSLIILISACNSNIFDKYQINNNNAHPYYLDTTPLIELQTPNGITLPIQDNKYKIPNFYENQEIDKELDITPPIY